jgi:hypothetical protein
MTDYVDFLILINDKPAILAWLETHGVEVHRDENGVVLTKAESLIGICNTKIETDEKNGNKGIMIRFAAIVGTKIPVGTKTEYIKWRSDEGGPLPEFNVEDRDENGVVLGTYHKQTVARIVT